ncbi:MAG: helix-turn-helix domain-containing protein [Lachnospiraceae bacterium]|nr:helix-turn-helix domain-containing protein [Lachnospiraceae bacterium]MBO5144361.1 helix-turn-helix domain-containing protein [Lachnospiraceae bacterium]
MNFNERLKNIRKRAKVTQKSVSDYLGVTLRTYQRYEEGRIEPPLSTVSALSQYFDLPVDCLLGNGLFSNWDDILSHKEPILLYLKEEVISFPDDFDLSTLSESQLAHILPAVFTKITFDGSSMSFFLQLPTDSLPFSIHAD